MRLIIDQSKATILSCSSTLIKYLFVSTMTYNLCFVALWIPIYIYINEICINSMFYLDRTNDSLWSALYQTTRIPQGPQPNNFSQSFCLLDSISLSFMYPVTIYYNLSTNRILKGYEIKFADKHELNICQSIQHVN